MDYGIIYIKICPKRGYSGEWIKYCHMVENMPKLVQERIKILSQKINTMEGIVIPMDEMIHPGCTTTPDAVEEIAKAMYNGYVDVFQGQLAGNNFVRCVYTIGELDFTNHNKNVTSTHNILSPIMVYLGRQLDSSEEPGIFRTKY